MKERPILFSAPMVNAILDGRKTMTRRVMKLQPSMRPDLFNGDVAKEMAGSAWKGQTLAVWPGESEFDYCDCHCPYGAPGDLLWVREAHATVNTAEGPALAYRSDSAIRTWREFSETFGADYGVGPSMNYDAYPGEYCMWWEDLLRGEPDHRWKPSIHMPRWASRITLEVTDVRVERLQEISRKDAISEGCPFEHPTGVAANTDPKRWYSKLWDEINGTGSWASSPWVWVVEFKQGKANA